MIELLGIYSIVFMAFLWNKSHKTVTPFDFYLTLFGMVTFIFLLCINL